MKKFLAFVILATGSLSARAYELEGQPAKDLYLAMKNMWEVPRAFYSLYKSGTIECEHSFRGSQYDEHTQCTIEDDFSGRTIVLTDVEYHSGRQPSRLEGARELYASYNLSARRTRGSVVIVRTKTNCLLKSPIAPPSGEPAENFRCEVRDL